MAAKAAKVAVEAAEAAAATVAAVEKGKGSDRLFRMPAMEGRSEAGCQQQSYIVGAETCADKM
jgi:hypothetical protein